jgi:HlyD family type I secretion membrane fusion protein
MDVTLEQHGSGSKLNTYLSTSNRVDFDRLLAESQSMLNQSLHDNDSLEAQRQVFIVKWQEDIGTQLVAARSDLDEANQGLSKAERVSQLINLTAPEDAVVLQIGKASVGSVVDSSGSDAQPLFTLVPLGGALEADVEIDTSDIGYIKVGDPVQIKLDAYPYMRHGTAHGEIKTISEGSFVQGENQEIRSPYFKARIVMDDVHLRDVPASFRLIPGMTLAGDIMIGKRSIMSYLVEGGLRTGSEAMREP